MNQVIGESVDWNELTGGSIVDNDGLLFYTGTLLNVFGGKIGGGSLEIVFDKTLDSNYLPEEFYAFAIDSKLFIDWDHIDGIDIKINNNNETVCHVHGCVNNEKTIARCIEKIKAMPDI